jgi:hypothetical protein
MTTATKTAPTDAASERIRDLNEQILNAGKKVTGAYLTAHEKALESIVDMNKLYVSAGREFLK